MNFKILFLFFSAFYILASCTEVQKVADVITKPTAREVYERNFEKGDSTLLAFNEALNISKKDSLQIFLPYSESGIFTGENLNVYSYNLQLKEGERIVVKVGKQIDSVSVFLDIFQRQKDSLSGYKLLKSAEPNTSEIALEISVSGDYKITVQPEMAKKTSFILEIYTEPLYAFPVSGAGNKNVQSFWADPRDAGSRSHEGVDIFAERGTPVVAVSDGIVSTTGERGLGGKQVWMRDGLFGKSIYYAHLDSIASKAGQRVKRGDTLGFVGNTGNAKTTPPHLHFGIYKNNSGAVNPYPFIKNAVIQKVTEPSTVTAAIISKRRTDILKGPDYGFPKYASAQKNDTVSVLGKYQNWYHIRKTDGFKGYVNAASLTPISSN